MKFHLIALAAAAAFVGNAEAAKLTATQAAAATNILYIGGSSALQKLVEGMVSQNCDIDGLSTWRSKGPTGTKWFGASAVDGGDGASVNAYACTLKAGNDFGVAYDGQTILVVKREAGGSSQGVFPVGKPGSTTGVLAQSINVALCDATATTVNTGASNEFGYCDAATSTITRLPDMGISDVEPAIFNASINKPSAFSSLSVVDTDFEVAPTPFAQAVIGLVVNTTLYNDMQADQGLSGSQVPSFGQVAFANLWSGAYDVTQYWTPLLTTGSASALPLAKTQINIVGRSIGSGTRAAVGLFFNNSPSNKSGKQWAGSNSTPTAGTATGLRSVTSASSSGNVIAQVEACGATSKYCVGILGYEQVPSANVKFVNVEGQSAANARFGQYPVVYEATYQINKTAPGGAAAKALATAFGSAMAKPDNIFAAFNGNGVLALPQNCSGLAYTDWTSAAEKAVCSRVTRGGNSTLVLSVTK